MEALRSGAVAGRTTGGRALGRQCEPESARQGPLPARLASPGTRRSLPRSRGKPRHRPHQLVLVDAEHDLAEDRRAVRPLVFFSPKCAVVVDRRRLETDESLEVREALPSVAGTASSPLPPQGARRGVGHANRRQAATTGVDEFSARGHGRIRAPQPAGPVVPLRRGWAMLTRRVLSTELTRDSSSLL